jgi:hypothetical protein
LKLTEDLYEMFLHPIGDRRYSTPQALEPHGELGRCVEKYTPPTCPNWPEEHGDHRPAPEINRMYTVNRMPGDLLWYPDVILVKEEHSPLFSHLTGVELRPVELFATQLCRVPLVGYVELRVLARVPVDLEKSGVRITYKCPLCGVTTYSLWDEKLGLHFDGTTEDWPDCFQMSPRITSLFFVKSRMAQMIVDHNLAPVALTRVQDLQDLSLDDGQ